MQGRALAPDEWPLAQALRGSAQAHQLIEIEPFEEPRRRKVVLLSAAPINGVGHGFQIAAVTALFGAVMSGSRVRRRPAEPDKEVEAF